MSEQEPDARDVIRERQSARDEAVQRSTNRGCLWAVGLVGAVVVLVAIASAVGDDEPSLTGRASGDGSRVVSSGMLGRSWPLEVSSGTLRCEVVGERAGVDLLAVTFEDPDGSVYAVNGTARDHTQHPDVHAIWRTNEVGNRVAIGELIQLGLDLC